MNNENGQSVVRLGDRTDHGGVVVEEAPDFMYMGVPIALDGHKVMGSKCKRDFPIIGRGERSHNGSRVDDDIDHGDKVISASTAMQYDDRFVARKGDEVSCPLRPDVRPKLILEGDETMMDDDIPVARRAHKATCGCHLIASVGT